MATVSTTTIAALSSGWQIFFGLLTPAVTFLVGVAAGIFAYYQYKINLRLKELQDYVGLSIIPLPNLQLRITNVGRTNLYLHRWEVGENSQTFLEPILISAESRSDVVITLNPISLGQKRAKFYLTDESREKFLSEGVVILTPISSTPILQVLPAQSPSGGSGTAAAPQIAGVQVSINVTALSYRTVRFEWNI